MAKAQAPGNPHVMAKRSKSALKMHLEKPEMAGFSVFRTSYKNDCEKNMGSVRSMFKLAL